MLKSAVAVIRCDSYDEQKVHRAVKRGIDLLGGAGCFVENPEKIVLKPNVLAGDRPEQCTTTHPAVFKAVGEIFKTVTPNLYYGDSPGFFRKPQDQMEKALLSREAEALHIPLADFDGGREVQFTESPFTKRFIIANGVMDSDGIISLSKLKTHQLTRFTGAVKNQFGCIPGLLKAKYHVKIPGVHDFAKMLVAINLLLKPRLFIMDGIMAMEGNGPRSGEPVNMNVLLFSRDPIALDAVVCRMIDLNPEFVPTMKPGKEWGLGTFEIEDIELLGDSIDSFFNPEFKVIRKPALDITAKGLISSFKRTVSSRPVIQAERCVCCGVCVEVCRVDPKALNWVKDDQSRPPAFDYHLCIRCFCCQELCPEKAIFVKAPFLGKIRRRVYDSQGD